MQYIVSEYDIKSKHNIIVRDIRYTIKCDYYVLCLYRRIKRSNIINLDTFQKYFILISICKQITPFFNICGSVQHAL